MQFTISACTIVKFSLLLTLCEGNPLVTNGFSGQRAHDAIVILTKLLIHWGWVTHICISKLTIIGSDNGLSPGRCQAIIWTNIGILLNGTLGIYFSEILSEIHTFSFKKMHLKMLSAKQRPFCLGLNVLKKQLCYPLCYQSISINGIDKQVCFPHESIPSTLALSMSRSIRTCKFNLCFLAKTLCIKGEFLATFKKITYWTFCQLIGPLRDLNEMIFEPISVTVGCSISCEIVPRWLSLDLTDDKSSLVQVMAWCHQATSHYLSQCWPRSLSPSGNKASVDPDLCCNIASLGHNWLMQATTFFSLLLGFLFSYKWCYTTSVQANLQEPTPNGRLFALCNYHHNAVVDCSGDCLLVETGVLGDVYPR